jgi:hypothetical protein
VLTGSMANPSGLDGLRSVELVDALGEAEATRRSVRLARR